MQNATGTSMLVQLAGTGGDGIAEASRPGGAGVWATIGRAAAPAGDGEALAWAIARPFTDPCRQETSRQNARAGDRIRRGQSCCDDNDMLNGRAGGRAGRIPPSSLRHFIAPIYHARSSCHGAAEHYDDTLSHGEWVVKSTEGSASGVRNPNGGYGFNLVSLRPRRRSAIAGEWRGSACRLLRSSGRGWRGERGRCRIRGRSREHNQ